MLTTSFQITYSAIQKRAERQPIWEVSSANGKRVETACCRLVLIISGNTLPCGPPEDSQHAEQAEGAAGWISTSPWARAAARAA